jgi:hypothetical protein
MSEIVRARRGTTPGKSGVGAAHQAPDLLEVRMPIERLDPGIRNTSTGLTIDITPRIEDDGRTSLTLRPAPGASGEGVEVDGAIRPIPVSEKNVPVPRTGPYPAVPPFPGRSSASDIGKSP